MRRCVNKEQKGRYKEKGEPKLRRDLYKVNLPRLRNRHHIELYRDSDLFYSAKHS